MSKNTAPKQLKHEGLPYKESDFWYDSIIGKEIVRFDWRNPKYKGHHKKNKNVEYFDDFIMDELKRLAEQNSGLGRLA